MFVIIGNTSTHKKAMKPIILIKAITNTGLIYLGSGAGQNMQIIIALKHALILVLKLNINISERTIFMKAHKKQVINSNIRPKLTPII